MSKTIIFMRHGMDLGESLASMGVKQATDIAQQLMKAGLEPDTVITSPSGRTVETGSVVTQQFRAAGHEIGEVRADKALSLERDTILFALTKLTSQQTILVVGHEYDLTSAVKSLTGEEWSPGFAGVAVVTSKEPDWMTAVRSSSNQLERTLRPTL